MVAGRRGDTSSRPGAWPSRELARGPGARGGGAARPTSGSTAHAATPFAHAPAPASRSFRLGYFGESYPRCDGSRDPLADVSPRLVARGNW